MSSLQLSLLIVGILIVGIIYVWSRFKLDKPFTFPFFKQKDIEDDIPELDDEIVTGSMFKSSSSAELDTETLSRLSGINVSRDEPVDLERLKGISINSSSASSSMNSKPVDDTSTNMQAAHSQNNHELIIVLNVMARQHTQGKYWNGEQLFSALEQAGLHLNEMKIYQYNTAQGGLVFGVANAVEPGLLDPSTESELVTPGLTFFLQLPGPLEPHQAFITMLDVAEQVATHLDGEVCDDKRNKLTSQSINQIKDQIDIFSLKQAH